MRAKCLSWPEPVRAYVARVWPDHRLSARVIAEEIGRRFHLTVTPCMVARVGIRLTGLKRTNGTGRPTVRDCDACRTSPTFRCAEHRRAYMREYRKRHRPAPAPTGPLTYRVAPLVNPTDPFPRRVA